MYLNEIKFLWHGAGDNPYDIEKPVLVQTKEDKLIAFNNTMSYENGDLSKPYSVWKWMVNQYKIKYWCYQYAITEYNKDDYSGR